MKPHLNRIALLRSHISMVFILFVSLIAGISINLSILVELFEDEVELIQLLYTLEMIPMMGLVLLSIISMILFILYHMNCDLRRDPIQLDENELVVRNAAGDAIRVTVDPNRTHSTLEIINLDVLPTYEDLFGQKQPRQSPPEA